MARLIDSDRLYKQIEARYRQSSGEEHRAERSLLDAVCDSPIVDAIPVEWLWQYMSEMLNDSRTTFKECAMIGNAISAWQKVQEAWQKVQEAI